MNLLGAIPALPMLGLWLIMHLGAVLAALFLHSLHHSHGKFSLRRWFVWLTAWCTLVAAALQAWPTSYPGFTARAALSLLRKDAGAVAIAFILVFGLCGHIRHYLNDPPLTSCSRDASAHRH